MKRQKSGFDEEDAQLQDEAPAAPADGTPAEANLEKLVLMPTWREMLMDLVHRHQLDPWNIDVVDISNRYITQLKALQTNDLRIPANLILAAAILLRFKSDMLSLEEVVQQATLETFVEETGPVEIPMLELRTRIPPKRRVTLDELVAAMDKVFSEQREREEKRARVPQSLPPALEIKLAEFNIDEHIGKVQHKINTRRDGEGLVTFSALLDEKTREHVVFTLLPLLFLAQRGAVTLAQDPFFGEIFIRMLAQGQTKRDGRKE